MSSSFTPPNPWTFENFLGGGVDLSLAVTQLPTIQTQSTFKGDVNSDLALSIKQIPEIKLGVTQLPQIDIQFGIRPMRVHFPTTMKFTICAFGMEVLSLSTCGESMVVIENYHPHARELCR